MKLKYDGLRLRDTWREIWLKKKKEKIKEFDTQGASVYLISIPDAKVRTTQLRRSTGTQSVRLEPIRRRRKRKQEVIKVIWLQLLPGETGIRRSMWMCWTWWTDWYIYYTFWNNCFRATWTRGEETRTKSKLISRRRENRTRRRERRRTSSRTFRCNDYELRRNGEIEKFSNLTEFRMFGSNCENHRVYLIHASCSLLTSCATRD